jgi:hypothetical protein
MAMRNYGAMLDAKLLRCIGELRGEYGEACERVRRQTKWPANSIGENLKAATAVARSRGLTPQHSLPAPAPEPPKPVCRGCAGTGVDISVHPRVMQVAEGPWLIGPKSGAKRGTFTEVGLGEPPKVKDHGGWPSPTLAEMRSANQALGKPLAQMLPLLAKARTEDREIKHLPSKAEIPFPLAKEHACTWCDGTGEPQPTTGVTP